MRSANANNIVDIVWSLALDKITKAGPATAIPRGLGEHVDLAVAQAGTAALLSRQPAFDKLLYNAGYAAAVRNTYLVLRRLGMPTDFFWKFERWEPRRAFDTLEKVVTRIFTALLSKEGAGLLKLVAADPVRLRFELEFEDCAECAGLASHGPMCFYHAGSFAGMLSAMLDHELDAWEDGCSGSGAAACRFHIGERDDRETSVSFERWMDGFTYVFDPAARFSASLGNGNVRAMGNLVDVGYYQMLLASAVLTNIDVIDAAAVEAGRSVGSQLADVARHRFGDDPKTAVEGLYRQLRYAALEVTEEGQGYTVTINEAPEHLGPLEGSAVVQFLTGEIEGLLTSFIGRPLSTVATEVAGSSLVLRFSP